MQLYNKGKEVYVASDEKKEIKVPSFEQKHSWDCGLACVCMVIRYLGHDDRNVHTVDHQELGCGDSVWTIDLAYLLKKYGIRNKLTTTTIGVDKGYSSASFYKHNFSKDEERVNTLFEKAESHGIMVEKRSVSLEEIKHHIKGDNLVIALVDWTYLECIWCDQSVASCISCLKLCSKCCTCNNYNGHYIVICGYDNTKDRVFYKNPSYNKEMCCSRASQLDKARKSYGTDEDTLFIYCDT